MSDDLHWLWRFDAQQWLLAAQREWQLARSRTDARRSCITHLRRAVGMGLNAVLVQAGGDEDLDPETHWGRSYMDHIHQAAQSPKPLPAHVAPVLERLRKVSLHSPTPALVALRTGPSLAMTKALHDSAEILEICAEYCRQAN